MKNSLNKILTWKRCTDSYFTWLIDFDFKCTTTVWVVLLIFFWTSLIDSLVTKIKYNSYVNRKLFCYCTTQDDEMRYLKLSQMKVLWQLFYFLQISHRENFLYKYLLQFDYWIININHRYMMYLGLVYNYKDIKSNK